MKIVLIGAGNVATHLAEGLKRAGHTVIEVYSRTAASANALAKKIKSKACTDIGAISDQADLYIVALADHAVKDFLKSFPLTNKVVIHTSGSLPLAVFDKKFTHCGVIYPVQTFSKKRKLDTSSVPLCIEWSDKKAKQKTEAAARSLSKKIFMLNSAKRKQVHLAAVFANNFSNHLFSIAETILSDAGLGFDMIRPLILETALKVQSDYPTRMQTGPAKRGDTEVIKEHIKMLKVRELREIYKLFTYSIGEHYQLTR